MAKLNVTTKSPDEKPKLITKHQKCMTKPKVTTNPPNEKTKTHDDQSKHTTKNNNLMTKLEITTKIPPNYHPHPNYHQTTTK